MQNVNMITSRPITTKIGTNISFEGDDEGVLLVRVVVGLGLAIVAFIEVAL